MKLIQSLIRLPVFIYILYYLSGIYFTKLFLLSGKAYFFQQNTSKQLLHKTKIVKRKSCKHIWPVNRTFIIARGVRRMGSVRIDGRYSSTLYLSTEHKCVYLYVHFWECINYFLGVFKHMYLGIFFSSAFIFNQLALMKCVYHTAFLCIT